MYQLLDSPGSIHHGHSTLHRVYQVLQVSGVLALVGSLPERVKRTQWSDTGGHIQPARSSCMSIPGGKHADDRMSFIIFTAHIHLAGAGLMLE